MVYCLKETMYYDKFNDLNYNELNNYNSELIGKSTVNDNCCFIYFVNNIVFY